MSGYEVLVGIDSKIAKIIESFCKTEDEETIEIEFDGVERELSRFDCFGCIIPSFTTLSDAFEYAKNAGISTFQTFFGDSISTDRQNFSESDVMKVKKEYPDFKCFSHLPFTFSLVGTSKRGVFKIDSLTKKFNDPYAWRICKAIEQELKITKDLNSGTVIHPGSAIGTTEESIEAIVRFLDSIDYPIGSKLLLENSAMEGKKIASLDNLNKIYQKCREKVNIFFCLDTQHIFASGEYNLSETEEIDRLYEDIQQKMGIEKIALIHLNDSKVGFGSRKDRHEFSCQGQCWGNNFFSFLYFLSRFEGIPLVCETDIQDVYQIRRMVYDVYD